VRTASRCGRGPVFHAPGEEKAEQGPLRLVGVERDELQDLARRGHPVDAGDEVALGQGECALLGESRGRHEPLVEVPEGRMHGRRVAERAHRLQDQGLGRAGRLRHVGRRLRAVDEAGRARPVGQTLDEALTEVGRGGAGRRGRRVARGPDADLDEETVEPKASGLVRPRHQGSGRQDWTQAHDVALAQQHPHRRLVGAEGKHTAAALPVEAREEREGLRRAGIGLVHGR
jgi:hypothetical protein